LLLLLVLAWKSPSTAFVAHSAEPIAVRSLLRAALTALFTYQGFEIVPMVAGQARMPTRDIPIAVLGSLTLASFLYIALQWACVRALPNLATSSAPIAEAASFYGGPSFGLLLALGTSLSALGIAVGMMIMTPRYLAAIGNAVG